MKLTKILALSATALVLPTAVSADVKDTDALSPLHMAAIKASYAEPETLAPDGDRLSAIELFRLVEAVRVYDLGQPPHAPEATGVKPESS